MKFSAQNEGEEGAQENSNGNSTTLFVNADSSGDDMRERVDTRWRFVCVFSVVFVSSVFVVVI